MIVYNPADLAAIEADLILEVGSDIYLCWCSRKNGTPDTAAECWKIKKVEQTTATVGDLTGTQTKILYPYGKKNFEFAPDNISSYIFSFAN